MPIPPAPLRRGDQGAAVAALQRTLEAVRRPIDPSERDARSFGEATEKVVGELQQDSGLAVTGVFDDETRAALERMLADVGPFSVYGAVTDADGEPVAGATVLAEDVDLRRAEKLGRATTDSGGEYEVRYTARQFVRREKAGADVRV